MRSKNKVDKHGNDHHSFQNYYGTMKHINLNKITTNIYLNIV